MRDMSVEPKSLPIPSTEQEVDMFMSEEFIQEIWVTLAREVTCENICQTVDEVASEYRDAKVTTYLPILIRRRTLERLKAEKDGPARQDGIAL